MNEITPQLLCELTVEGERMPVYAYTIESEEGTILVDTGMIDLVPALEDWQPVQLHPLPKLDVVAVINTHLHVDHCGGNRLFAETPIFVQRTELDACRAQRSAAPGSLHSGR